MTQTTNTPAEAFAWAAFAENGNVIIWSKHRSEVEPVATKYKRPVVPVIAILVAAAPEHARTAVPAHLREFLEAVAGPMASYIDRETDEHVCSGCNVPEVYRGALEPSEEAHKEGCIVLRARAMLAAASSPAVLNPLDLTCLKCGVDRLEKPCPRMADECAMVADAHMLSAGAAAKTDHAPLYVAYGDDDAVDQFAAAMKAKMAASRAKGRGGWHDPDQCPTERLQSMLIEHLAKGDPVDIGNFAMMLFNRGESTVSTSAAGAGSEQAPTDWAECERIADLPEVDDALRGFLEDATGDNCTCVVRAILQAVGVSFDPTQRSRDYQAGVMQGVAEEGAARFARECAALVQQATAGHAAPDLDRLIAEHRIAIVPEYEGGFRAQVYRDQDEALGQAHGKTPREAVDTALAAVQKGGA